MFHIWFRLLLSLSNHFNYYIYLLPYYIYKGSGDLMVKMAISHPRDRRFEPHTGHDRDSSYDTSTGWF